MIRLICVGKSADWDYVRKDTVYHVRFLKSFGSKEVSIPVEEVEYIGFVPGCVYDFIAEAVQVEERSP